jgi:hypothetical protein
MLVHPSPSARSSHTDVVASEEWKAPSTWRQGDITTTIRRHGDDKVRLERIHTNSRGHFTLNTRQLAILLDVMRFPFTNCQVIFLPGCRASRVEARVLPDHGIHLYRFEHGKPCATFRLHSWEVMPFITFCQRTTQ